MKKDVPRPKKKELTAQQSKRVAEKLAPIFLERLKRKGLLKPRKTKETERVLQAAEEILDNPKASRYWSDHLEYLLANGPKDLWRMFLDDRLEKELDRVAERAEIAEYKLEERGLPRNQADELVRADLVSPYLDQDPPDRLPNNIEDLIREWALKIQLASEEMISEE